MQKQMPEPLLKILKDKVNFVELDYYAWPQTFPDTTGPCGGYGGQQITKFTVEAWVCDGTGPTILLCCGMYSFEDGRYAPFKHVKKWHKLIVPARAEMPTLF